MTYKRSYQYKFDPRVHFDTYVLNQQHLHIAHLLLAVVIVMATPTRVKLCDVRLWRSSLR